MKIRNGFVSNSSSSSFCILGAYINDSNLYEKLQDKYYQDFEFYSGDEEGYVLGVYASEYLQKENLPDACKTAMAYVQRLMDKEDFEELMKHNKENGFQLIYDSYCC